MSNLKTLNDIQPKEVVGYTQISKDFMKGFRESTRYFNSVLRTEAIDWINHYNKLEEEEKYNGINCQGEIQWIMYFFDIKEDEIEW